MATQQVSMMGGVVPDSTGRCWFEPFDVIATNDVWKNMVARFKDPTSGQFHGIYGVFTVPQNFVSAASVIVVWTSSATSNNCQFRLTYRAVGGDNSESLDQTSNQEQVTVTDAAPGAAFRRLTPAFTVTSGNFAAGDTVTYLLERGDTGTSVDTMAADAVVFDVLFSYSDT